MKLSIKAILEAWRKRRERLACVRVLACEVGKLSVKRGDVIILRADRQTLACDKRIPAVIDRLEKLTGCAVVALTDRVEIGTIEVKP